MNNKMGKIISFIKEEHPSLELIVVQININPGYNDEFLDACS